MVCPILAPSTFKVRRLHLHEALRHPLRRPLRVVAEQGVGRLREPALVQPQLRLVRLRLGDAAELRHNRSARVI